MTAENWRRKSYVNVNVWQIEKAMHGRKYYGFYIHITMGGDTVSLLGYCSKWLCTVAHCWTTGSRNQNAGRFCTVWASSPLFRQQEYLSKASCGPKFFYVQWCSHPLPEKRGGDRPITNGNAWHNAYFVGRTEQKLWLLCGSYQNCPIPKCFLAAWNTLHQGIWSVCFRCSGSIVIYKTLNLLF